MQVINTGIGGPRLGSPIARNCNESAYTVYSSSYVNNSFRRNPNLDNPTRISENQRTHSRTRQAFGEPVGRSSNGKTADSGSAYRGSNPCLPANSYSFPLRFLLISHTRARNGYLQAVAGAGRGVHPTPDSVVMIKTACRRSLRDRPGEK